MTARKRINGRLVPLARRSGKAGRRVRRVARERFVEDPIVRPPIGGYATMRIVGEMELTFNIDD